jgi:hypothetical protein
MISQEYPPLLKLYLVLMNNSQQIICVVSLIVSVIIAFTGSDKIKVQPSNFSDFTIALHALYIGSYLYILDLFVNNASFKSLMGDEWKNARKEIQQKYFSAMCFNACLMLFFLFSSFKGSDWEIKLPVVKIIFSFLILTTSLFLIPIFLSVHNFGKRALDLDLD